MDPERWKQIDALLSAALQREGGQRASFLAQACEGDEDLQEQIQKLISAHEAASSLFRSQWSKTRAWLYNELRTEDGE